MDFAKTRQRVFRLHGALGLWRLWRLYFPRHLRLLLFLRSRRLAHVSANRDLGQHSQRVLGHEAHPLFDGWLSPALSWPHCPLRRIRRANLEPRRALRARHLLRRLSNLRLPTSLRRLWHSRRHVAISQLVANWPCGGTNRSFHVARRRPHEAWRLWHSAHRHRRTAIGSCLLGANLRLRSHCRHRLRRLRCHAANRLQVRHRFLKRLAHGHRASRPKHPWCRRHKRRRLSDVCSRNHDSALL